MSKNTKISVFIVIILVIIGIVWYSKSGSTPAPDTNNTPTEQTTSAPVTETQKVSSALSEFKNAELGFSVKYPTAWEAAQGDVSVSFVMPIDTKQVSTVAKLQADVSVSPGKCSFPPVTTVKERTTAKLGDKSFSMISMSNNVQGRTYFNRMYSIEKDSICYTFAFASITLSPASKNLTGSNLTQAQNNNKAIVDSADKEFTTMVKSFEFVTGPQGIDETKAPVKK